MSQFAAQREAGSPAAPQSGGLAPPEEAQERRAGRGSAAAFRLLKQRLASTTIIHLLSHGPPPEEPELDPAPADGREAHIPQPDRAATDDVTVSVNVISREPEPPDETLQGAVEAFELLEIAAAERPETGSDVDLSAFEAAMGPQPLLLGHVSPPAGPDAMPELNAGAIGPVHEHPAAEEEKTEGGAAASPPLRLLLEPELPALDDEFAIAAVDRFFAAPSQRMADMENGAELELDKAAAEGSRAIHYRFWEQESEELRDSQPAAAEPPPAPAESVVATCEEMPAAPESVESAPSEESPEPPFAFAEEMQSASPVEISSETLFALPEETPPEPPTLEPAQPPSAPHDEAAQLAAEASEAPAEAADEAGEASPLAEAAELKRPAETRRRAVMLRKAGGQPSEEAGEVARSLLEIMSLPANTTQPQERALAADSLLHLVHRLPVHTLVTMAERLSIMESPPPLILAELIHDARIEVAGPLLEKCSAINDHDLIEVIADGHKQSNRMIARRRTLTAVLCDALIATEDPSTVLTLVRNPGALISHEAFFRLNELANNHHALQAPLATRSDLPAPVAFELFWVLPPELRRYVISRFLTDSSTLHRILQLTKQMDSDPQETTAQRFSSREDLDRLLEFLVSDDSAGAARLLADLLGLQHATALRILSDPEGEPFAVALKALGATRAGFEEIFVSLNQSAERNTGPRRNAGELQGLFESLSFTKARILLTYWDWAVLRTGPYTGLTA